VLLLGNYGTLEQRLLVALAGYGAYVINAGQFLWKLRMARLEGSTIGQAVAA
jgi:3-vinyl bacteriochlorophyllide hydratase